MGPRASDFQILCQQIAVPDFLALLGKLRRGIYFLPKGFLFLPPSQGRAQEPLACNDGTGIFL